MTRTKPEQPDNWLADLANKLQDYQRPGDKPDRDNSVRREENRQSLVEQRIQDALANGAFDNLPGKGKPLNLKENPHQEPGQEWAFNWLKRNGFAPEWIERNKEIRREIDRARQTLRDAWQTRQQDAANEPQWQAALAHFEQSLHKINAKIDDFNLMVPILSAQRTHLKLERELHRLKASP